MAKTIKQTFKGDLIFNHVDPHYARFNVDAKPGKNDKSEFYGMRPINITPGMFPEDFELSEYDVTGSIEVVVEIKKKK